MVMADWKAGVIHDLKTTTLPVASIASKHGRSPTSVWKLKRDENIKREPVKRGMKRFIEMDVLSPEHTKLGHYLTRLRHGEGETKTSIANALGLSASKFGQWESGRHDFTLSEMQAISAWLGEDRFRVQVAYGMEPKNKGRLH
jgi:hypothetical protein